VIRMVPVRPVLRRAAAGVLVAALGTGMVGCRRPSAPGLPRVGRVDLGDLVTVHPGWSRVYDLDLKIAKLGVTPTFHAPLFASPAPVRLDPVEATLSAVDAEQRAQMVAVIAERVKRDFDARAAQLRRRAGRNERRSLANALALVETRIVQEREIYAAEYNGVARRYADQLGPRYLRLIAFQPTPLGATFYPPEERVRRAEERARLGREIEDLFVRRAEELNRLQTSHVAKLADLRTTAREAALAQAREEGIRALAELESQRRDQQAQLEADLERTLERQSDAVSAPAGDLSAERQSLVLKVGALNREADSHLVSQRAATAAAIATLRRQRQALMSQIQSATEAAAGEVAAERHLKLEFAPGEADRALTEWLVRRLRERWATPMAKVRSPGT
jgi:hypothetical protein